MAVRIGPGHDAVELKRARDGLPIRIANQRAALQHHDRDKLLADDEVACGCQQPGKFVYLALESKEMCRGPRHCSVDSFHQLGYVDGRDYADDNGRPVTKFDSTLLMRNPNGYSRPAVIGDLAFIEAWLPTDRAIDTLAVNWATSRKQLERGQLLVWEDAEPGQALAYFWDSMTNTDSVLDVHPRYRRNGIGRTVAGYLINSAIASGEPLLEMDCPTDSAVSFWRAMGVSSVGRRPWCATVR